MKFVRYSKYVPDPAVGNEHGGPAQRALRLSAQSGFQNPYRASTRCPTASSRSTTCGRPSSKPCMNGDSSTKRCASVSRKCKSDGTLDAAHRATHPTHAAGGLHLASIQPHDPSQQSGTGGQVGTQSAQAKFEITDKSLDFLGFRTLRDLHGIARQIQFRTARHARYGHGHRSQRRLQAHTNSATR